MTKKSEDEKVTGEGEEKTSARKTTVRKTIRRVRKATTRTEPPAGDDQESPDRDEEAPAAKSGRRRSGTTKRVPSKPDAKETPEDRSDDSGDDRKAAEPEIKVTVESPKKFGRVSKGGSDDDQGSGEERGGGREERGGGREERGGGREERRGERRGRGRRSSNRPKPEPVDPKALASKAWKLYQADIAEEGIALVDDKAGRQLALRSFDLARIFLEEKARQQRNAGGQQQEPSSED